MKNKKLILTLILIICVVFVGRIIYFEVLKQQFITNLNTAIYSDAQTIILKDLTPFEWDELYWGYTDSYGFAAISIGNVWIFYNDEQVVAEINLGTEYPQILWYEKCICPSPAKYRDICFTPSTAIFEIIRGNSSEMVQLKSIICG